MHWGAEYIGKPWLPGGRDLSGLDCWGLVYHIYRERFGIELPAFPGVEPGDHALVAKFITEGAATGGDWQRMATGRDGCVVALGKTRALHHVGLWLDTDGGLVLHASYGGVIAQSLATLRSFRWHRIEFYKHHGFHS